MADRIINAFHGGEAFWRYAYELEAAYRRGMGSWLPDPDFALSRDPEIWQKVRRDPLIDQAISQREHSVGGRPRHAVPPEGFEEPPYELGAALMTGAMKRIRNMPDAQLQLSKMVFQGRAYAFVEGRRYTCELAPGTGMRRWWVPTRLKNIDRLRVRRETRDRGDGVTTKMATVMSLYDINSSTWVELPPTPRLIEGVYDDEESRLGYGRGILDSIYYYHYAKGVLLREGLNGAERFGQGTLIYEYARDTFGGEGTPNTTVASTALNVLEKLTSRNQAAIPEGDKIHRLDPSDKGHRMIVDLLNYLDEGLTRRITGSLLPTGGGSDRGSMARAEVEQQTTNTLIEYDQSLLDGALTHGLVPAFWQMNRAELRSLGVDDRHRPTIEAKVERTIDPKTTADVLQKLWTANPALKIRTDELMRSIGFSEVKEGEETTDALEGKLILAAASTASGGGGSTSEGGVDNAPAD